MKWTSHPLVDVGIAALCAMANRDRPEDLGLDDLDAVTEEMASAYFSGVMGSYLSCVFMNSGYCNPTMKAEGRSQYKERILKAYRQDPPPELHDARCVFSGEP